MNDFERASQAWDSGDYLTALRGFDAILRGPDADRWFERIALITGELYEVTEVAPDGGSLRFSPSGRYAAFDTGARPAVVTHIVDIERRLAKVADIQGSNLVFSPARETVAFLRARSTPEILSLRKEIEDLSKAATPDRQALTGKQQQLSAIEAVNMEIILRDLATGKEQRLEDDGLLKAGIAFSADGREVYLAGGKESDTATSEIYALSETAKPRAITSGPGFKTNPIVVPGRQVPRLHHFCSVAVSPRWGNTAGRTWRQTGWSAIRSPRRRQRRRGAGRPPGVCAAGSHQRCFDQVHRILALDLSRRLGAGLHCGWRRRKQHPVYKAGRPDRAGHHQEVPRANRVRSTIS